MKVDFEDSQLTQRVSKILFDLYKETWENQMGKIAKIATDTQIPIYNMLRLKSGPVLGKQ